MEGTKRTRRKGVMIMKTLNWIAISLLCAATLAAQDRPFQRGEGERRRGGGMHQGALGEHLQFTEQQLADLRAAKMAFHEDSKPTMDALREARRALHEELQLESPNPSIVGERVVESHQLGNQLKADRAANREQLLNILNDTQREQIEQLEGALNLLDAARQAVAMNFLEGPGRGPDGPGFGPGARGFGGHRGPGKRRLRHRGRMGGGPHAPEGPADGEGASGLLD